MNKNEKISKTISMPRELWDRVQAQSQGNRSFLIEKLLREAVEKMEEEK